MKPAPSLDDVAGAILDGSAVDWNVVESGSAPSDQPVVSQLKTLAALRLVSRRTDVTTGPTSWGHLRVFERIGRGAFGEVYRAWDTRLDREVALKLLPSASAGTDSPGSAIIEEGRLLARVRHPNVVTIYGAERIDGRIGLWMEFIKGRTLEESLRDGPAFADKEVARIGVELCRAVSAVHAAGLLHRDIKAQNVMVADDGRLVLMDFGTGRELASTSESNVAGTPLYLAPEVLSGAAATLQSEVYSIGVLLYRLLTGDYPVKGRDLAYLRRAHAAREQADPDASGPGIPPRLRRVITKAIDPNPGRRYASADALAAALTAEERVPATRRIAYFVAAAIAITAAGLGIWEFRHRLGLSPGAAAAVEATAPAIDTPVIAVMPFRNLSSEPDSGDFVDGLTSEVIRNLGMIDGLQVRSQTSSFSLKDQPRNAHVIGEQLGANLLVEADVLRDGNRLRINAQLVQVAGDVPLWSERFDRRLDDVFAIQDEISLAIVNKLRLTLGRGQRRYETNPQAYELYLRARAVRPGTGDGRGPERAIELFKQVIAIDPTFAPAFAGLASAYVASQWNISTRPFPEMRPAAARALVLDPLLAEAHAAMGLTYTAERDWQNATKSYERALELNPNLTQIHTGYSDTLVLMGQPERALQLLEQARIMDPLSLAVRRDLAFAQLINGRVEEALANLQQLQAVDPDINADLLLGRALMLAERHEEAIAFWKSAQNSWERWLARAYVMTGRTKELERLVAAHRNETAYRQAIIYAGLGDKDRTFEALDRAADIEPHRTAAILFFPEMKLLLGDPRRDALKRKLKLP